MIAVSTSQPRKRIKRSCSKFDFDKCCPIQNETIPKDLQQIRVDNTEIQRRIDCFINRKRDEINGNNIKDFITNKIVEENEEDSCARVHSTVYRIKDTKSHLKIHRVKNETGPQTHNYTMALDKLMEGGPAVNIKPDPDAQNGVGERLNNIESFLQLNAEEISSKSLLQRIKQIENKILYLETMSPEYMHFLVSLWRKAILIWRL